MSEQSSTASRIGSFVYGTLCYLTFLVAFSYLIGFVGNLVVPKGIDTGTAGSPTTAALINILLLSLFVVQHSVMARPAFKRWWTRFVPKPVERSTYVLFTSLILLFIYWQWQPMPREIWSFEGTAVGTLLTVLYFVGWGLVFYATLLIDHFDLFGMRQVVLHLRERKYTHHPFSTPALYKYMRHPLYLGWFIAFWATPTMSEGHFLFALVTSTYIVMAVVWEERDLVAYFGDAYVRYQESTPKFLPLGKKKPSDAGRLSPAGQR